MKKYTYFLIVSLFFFACNTAENNTSDDTSKNNSDNQELAVADIQTVNFIVDGMTCEGCENSLKKNVSKAEGIVEVSASHVEKNAIVKYDANKTTKENIENIITDIGYTVEGENVDTEGQTDSTSTH